MPLVSGNAAQGATGHSSVVGEAADVIYGVFAGGNDTEQAPSSHPEALI